MGADEFLSFRVSHSSSPPTLVGGMSCQNPLTYGLYVNRILLILFIGTLSVVACSGSRAVPLGVMTEPFFSCPSTPNCVSSQATDPARHVEPLRYTGSLSNVRERLVAIIAAMGQSRIVTLEEEYIHATFTSRLLRFSDDVEFHFDDSAKFIHVRSASHVGHYDFGVNRRRVEQIRARFIVE